MKKYLRSGITKTCFILQFLQDERQIRTLHETLPLYTYKSLAALQAFIESRLIIFQKYMYRDQIVRQGLLTLRALKYYAEDKD